MSLLNAIILPRIEKELIALEPQIAQFVLKELKSIGASVFAWAEEKIHLHEEEKKETK